MLWRHKAHSDGLSLVADCDVYVGMDRGPGVVEGHEFDVVTDCDVYVEDYEAKEVSVTTYWSSRLSPNLCATI